MRILYLVQYFVPPEGAWSTRSFEFAQQLVQSGHEVCVLTSSGMLPEQYRAYGKTREVFIHDIPVIVVPVPWANEMNYIQRVQALMGFAIGASRHALRQRPDLIYVSSPPLTIALPALLARLRFRVPMVFEVRDLWPELPVALGALRNPLLRQMADNFANFTYRSAAHIVALSPSAANVIQARGVPTDCMSVIPNFSDMELFSGQEDYGQALRSELGLRPDQPLIAYVGTLGFIHGVDYVVKLAAEMQQIAPDVRFLLVGGGKMRERIREEAQARGVLDKTLFMYPSVPKNKVPMMVNAADVCLSTTIAVPELEHNSANKFFDALAAGKPLAINYGGWQAELIRETGIGIVMPPRDPGQGARMLAEFIQAPDRLKEASKKARQLAETRFSKDQATHKFVSILENAAKVKKK